MTAQLHCLNAHPFFRAEDTTTLCEAVETRLGAKIIKLPARAERPGSAANRYALPRSELFFCDYRLPISLGFPDSDYLRVQFHRAGSGGTQVGGQWIEVTPNQGCVSSAGARIDFGEGFQQVVWRIRTQHLVAALSALTGSPATATLDFDCWLDLSTPQGIELQRLVDFVLDGLDRGIGSPLVLAELEQTLMVALLCAGRHNYRNRLDRDSPGAAPWQVRRAEAYIDAHWDQPISIEDLVAATGASARSIFRSFRQSRECSPLDYARQLRLRKARQMLESEGDTASITEIALTCGFGDLGHFSREFRAAYGERPSDVVHRAKWQAGHDTRGWAGSAPSGAGLQRSKMMVGSPR